MNKRPPSTPLLPKLSGRYRWQRTLSGARLFIDNRRSGGKRQNVGHYTRAALECALGLAPVSALNNKQAKKAEELKRLLAEIQQEGADALRCDNRNGID